MNKPSLFDCAVDGPHVGPIVEIEPVDSGESVNAIWACSRCGLITGEVSYSREGWDLHLQAQRKKSA